MGCGEGLNVGGFLNKEWMLFGTGFLVFFFFSQWSVWENFEGLDICASLE